MSSSFGMNPGRAPHGIEHVVHPPTGHRAVGTIAVVRVGYTRIALDAMSFDALVAGTREVLLSAATCYEGIPRLDLQNGNQNQNSVNTFVHHVPQSAAVTAVRAGTEVGAHGGPGAYQIPQQHPPAPPRSNTTPLSWTQKVSKPTSAAVAEYQRRYDAARAQGSERTAQLATNFFGATTRDDRMRFAAAPSHTLPPRVLTGEHQSGGVVTKIPAAADVASGVLVTAFVPPCFVFAYDYDDELVEEERVANEKAEAAKNAYRNKDNFAGSHDSTSGAHSASARPTSGSSITATSASSPNMTPFSATARPGTSNSVLPAGVHSELLRPASIDDRPTRATASQREIDAAMANRGTIAAATEGGGEGGQKTKTKNRQYVQCEASLCKFFDRTNGHEELVCIIVEEDSFTDYFALPSARDDGDGEGGGSSSGNTRRGNYGAGEGRSGGGPRHGPTSTGGGSSHNGGHDSVDDWGASKRSGGGGGGGGGHSAAAVPQPQPSHDTAATTRTAAGDQPRDVSTPPRQQFKRLPRGEASPVTKVNQHTASSVSQPQPQTFRGPASSRTSGVTSATPTSVPASQNSAAVPSKMAEVEGAESQGETQPTEQSAASRFAIDDLLQEDAKLQRVMVDIDERITSSRAASNERLEGNNDAAVRTKLPTTEIETKGDDIASRIVQREAARSATAFPPAASQDMAQERKSEADEKRSHSFRHTEEYDDIPTDPVDQNENAKHGNDVAVDTAFEVSKKNHSQPQQEKPYRPMSATERAFASLGRPRRQTPQRNVVASAPASRTVRIATPQGPDPERKLVMDQNDSFGVGPTRFHRDQTATDENSNENARSAFERSAVPWDPAAVEQIRSRPQQPPDAPPNDGQIDRHLRQMEYGWRSDARTERETAQRELEKLQAQIRDEKKHNGSLTTPTTEESDSAEVKEDDGPSPQMRLDVAALSTPNESAGARHHQDGLGHGARREERGDTEEDYSQFTRGHEYRGERDPVSTSWPRRREPADSVELTGKYLEELRALDRIQHQETRRALAQSGPGLLTPKRGSAVDDEAGHGASPGASAGGGGGHGGGRRTSLYERRFGVTFPQDAEEEKARQRKERDDRIKAEIVAKMQEAKAKKDMEEMIRLDHRDKVLRATDKHKTHLRELIAKTKDEERQLERMQEEQEHKERYIRAKESYDRRKKKAEQLAVIDKERAEYDRAHPEQLPDYIAAVNENAAQYSAALVSPTRRRPKGSTSPSRRSAARSATLSTANISLASALGSNSENLPGSSPRVPSPKRLAQNAASIHETPNAAGGSVQASSLERVDEWGGASSSVRGAGAGHVTFQTDENQRRNGPDQTRALADERLAPSEPIPLGQVTKARALLRGPASSNSDQIKSGTTRATGDEEEYEPVKEQLAETAPPPKQLDIGEMIAAMPPQLLHPAEVEVRSPSQTPSKKVKAAKQQPTPPAPVFTPMSGQPMPDRPLSETELYAAAIEILGQSDEVLGKMDLPDRKVKKAAVTAAHRSLSSTSSTVPSAPPPSTTKADAVSKLSRSDDSQSPVAVPPHRGFGSKTTSDRRHVPSSPKASTAPFAVEVSVSPATTRAGSGSRSQSRDNTQALYHHHAQMADVPSSAARLRNASVASVDRAPSVLDEMCRAQNAVTAGSAGGRPDGQGSTHGGLQNQSGETTDGRDHKNREVLRPWRGAVKVVVQATKRGPFRPALPPHLQSSFALPVDDSVSALLRAVRALPGVQRAEGMMPRVFSCGVALSYVLGDVKKLQSDRAAKIREQSAGRNDRGAGIDGDLLLEGEVLSKIGTYDSSASGAGSTAPPSSLYDLEGAVSIDIDDDSNVTALRRCVDEGTTVTIVVRPVGNMGRGGATTAAALTQSPLRPDHDRWRNASGNPSPNPGSNPNDPSSSSTLQRREIGDSSVSGLAGPSAYSAKSAQSNVHSSGASSSSVAMPSSSAVGQSSMSAEQTSSYSLRGSKLSSASPERSVVASAMGRKMLGHLANPAAAQQQLLNDDAASPDPRPYDHNGWTAAEQNRGAAARGVSVSISPDSTIDSSPAAMSRAARRGVGDISSESAIAEKEEIMRALLSRYKSTHGAGPADRAGSADREVSSKKVSADVFVAKPSSRQTSHHQPAEAQPHDAYRPVSDIASAERRSGRLTAAYGAAAAVEMEAMSSKPLRDATASRLLMPGQSPDALRAEIMGARGHGSASVIQSMHGPTPTMAQGALPPNERPSACVGVSDGSPINVDLERRSMQDYRRMKQQRELQGQSPQDHSHSDSDRYHVESLLRSGPAESSSSAGGTVPYSSVPLRKKGVTTSMYTSTSEPTTVHGGRVEAKALRADEIMAAAELPRYRGSVDTPDKIARRAELD